MAIHAHTKREKDYDKILNSEFVLGHVWDYSSGGGGGLKCFLFKNILK